MIFYLFIGVIATAFALNLKSKSQAKNRVIHKVAEALEEEGLSIEDFSLSESQHIPSEGWREKAKNY